LGAVVV
jgi:hypothetical protein